VPWEMDLRKAADIPRRDYWGRAVSI